MRIENKTINKIPFENLGSIIEESFDLFKKTALINGVFLLLLSLILVTLAGIGMSLFVNPETLVERMKNFKPENFSIDETLIFIGISIAVNVLIIPFVGGMLKINQEADETGKANFSTLYSLVDNPAYLQLVLGAIFSTLISSIINFSPVFLQLEGSFLIISKVLVYVFAILNILTIPLIALKNYNFIDAFVASIKGVSNNFFLVLVMIILSLILAFLGFFALCIGFFFTIPILYTVQYVLCRRIFEKNVNELKS